MLCSEPDTVISYKQNQLCMYIVQYNGFCWFEFVAISGVPPGSNLDEFLPSPVFGRLKDENGSQTGKPALEQAPNHGRLQEAKQPPPSTQPPDNHRTSRESKSFRQSAREDLPASGPSVTECDPTAWWIPLTTTYHIGYIMAGSGLEEVFSTVYASNSIEKMMNGHAYSRTVKTYSLAQIILKIINITPEHEAHLSDILFNADQTEILSGTKLITKFEEQLQLLEHQGPNLLERLPTAEVSDSVLGRWTQGMASLQSVCEEVEQLSKVTFLDLEQYVELRPTRVQRDNHDLSKMMNWFREHVSLACLSFIYDVPFHKTPELISLHSGIVADATINCHLSEIEGTATLNSIIDAASQSSTVTVVGEDIALLVILTGLSNNASNVYLLKSDKGKTPQQMYLPETAIDRTHPSFKTTVRVFKNENAEPDPIAETGLRFLEVWYGQAGDIRDI
ncbi:hypothetical protein ILUMI_20837 [Ignelater luminosus]|uniref:Uncharacterized protein n=1 Tax=Ignelater luminosus TaxID=2038154 RepID=A0A8K0CDM7_IGNLU|nr:hypothetical protein ILUMI_20837 [Ignelater luminosus]